MTEEEITKNLDNRIMLLKWLVNNDIRDVHKVGSFFRKYYTGSSK